MATVANSTGASAAAPGGAKAPAAGSGGGSGNVAKRLQKELMGLMMSGSKDISAFPSGESILEWAGTITGPPASVYEGKTFKLSISFSETYPHQAPVVKFTTPTFHPNVDQAGNICLDILKDQWTPTYNVRTVLLSIQSLLADPNNDDPLNQAAAALWANQDEFAKMVDATYAKGGSSSS